MMSETTKVDSLLPSPKNRSKIDTLCFGSGRFLRSVLIPPLLHSKLKPVVIQTRGRSFLEYCLKRCSSKENGDDGPLVTYEVDTVQYDGVETSEEIGCFGAGTMGSNEGVDDILNLLNDMEKICIIGVGVTEAGLSSPSSPTMLHLAKILHKIYTLSSSSSLTCPNPNGKICIINTDNVPQNGSTIHSHMIHIAKDQHNDDEGFLEFLENKIAFCNTMVDRITSQRDGSNGLVPRCEPIPMKCLVIEDINGDLPKEFYENDVKNKFGVVIRTKPDQLKTDIDLKLRVANGTHTAIAHVMSLSSLLQTTTLSSTSSEAKLLLAYLDSLFEHQILSAAVTSSTTEKDVQAVYDDWRKRLTHSSFGLSTFFITQNGAAKGGIRIGPSIRDLVLEKKTLNVTTAFAMACILRFLTPSLSPSSKTTNEPTKKVKTTHGVYRGWLDTVKNEDNDRAGNGKDNVVMYADGLHYDLKNKWYEFRCSCNVPSKPNDSTRKLPLPDVLASLSPNKQPQSCQSTIRDYLIASDGGSLSDLIHEDVFEDFVKATSVLYARMISGDGALDILDEMMKMKLSNDGGKRVGFNTPSSLLIDGGKQGLVGAGISHRHIAPLHHQKSFIPDSSQLLKKSVRLGDLASVVSGEVSSAEVIDLHTHLLPPSHGSLCLWGIDELLTYHYLVAEYFMTAPASMTPEKFYALSKQKQANIIWKALFVDRSPVSEACRGVITTLRSIGLQEHVDVRDLAAIRKFYDLFRNDGLEGAERFSEMVYRRAGVRYAVMTNIPFDANEVRHWRPKRKEYPNQYKSALRVDPLLAGDRKTVETALKGSGYDVTLEGARQYLRDWCDTMKPEYMMASTPHNFVLNEDRPPKTGVNEDAMKQPFAFVDVTNPSGPDCAATCGEDDAAIAASVIDEKSDFLSEVLMKVCEERDLPVALKIGAHRGVNPKLLQAGDGVVAFADAGVLARLCTRFSNVRFLATFLSRNNQHEACVLASKFRNLHIYGCWWFCNNPSMIEEITKMRVEMLGTAFTAQHSDARVLDQLLYKWSHSRAVIADVLVGEYEKLVEAGWSITREEIRRDVQRLFGGSYEEFMSKSFLRT